MPFLQSALAGFFAAEIAGKVSESNGADNQKKELTKAAACAIVGGITAVATVDPVGGAVVAVETATHLIAAATDTEMPDFFPEHIFR